MTRIRGLIIGVTIQFCPCWTIHWSFKNPWTQIITGKSMNWIVRRSDFTILEIITQPLIRPI
jgi:hypothetical protein